MMFIRAVKLSLEAMDKRFTDLSRLKWDDLSERFKKTIQGQKIQERPFAYEFYHQFRKLWDSGSILSIVPDDVIIQAEVNKTYQEIPELHKIPDFLVHKPNDTNSNSNFAVIEFKVACIAAFATPSSKEEFKKKLRYDFDKLNKFKEDLRYTHRIEVVIGNESELLEAKNLINSLENQAGEEINIIQFNTNSWKASDYSITN